MNLKSLFKKYILPDDIDFVKALQEQSNVTNAVIKNLYDCFMYRKEDICKVILNDEHQATAIKDNNMHNLLSAFITPIDRESIYRAITELNWIVLSVKHFVLEVKAYEIHDLEKHEKILKLITEASVLLDQGFMALGKGQNEEIADLCAQVRSYYDLIVNAYVLDMAELSKVDNCQKLFTYKEALFQLREIGKRIYMTANTLEDIIVKMD